VDQQCIHFTALFNNHQVFITLVYASNKYVVRRELWSALKNFSKNTLDKPWLIAGDFNCITNREESVGGSYNPIYSYEFNDCIHQLGLLQPFHHGNSLSWTNNQSGSKAIFRRLDRCLINTKFSQVFNAHFQYLSKAYSDHAPMVISNSQHDHHPHIFRFLNMWTSHPTFNGVVASIWNTNIRENSYDTMTIKLKLLKSHLKSWNTLVFGNITDKIDSLETRLDLVEQSYTLTPNDHNL
jgi:hypothetical protein